MSIAGRLALVVGGAAATAFFVIVAATIGDCDPQVLARCVAEKDQAFARMLPRALFLYSLAACALLLWPRLLRWPRK
jgi:hypothetical protein